MLTDIFSPVHFSYVCLTLGSENWPAHLSWKNSISATKSTDYFQIITDITFAGIQLAQMQVLSVEGF